MKTAKYICDSSGKVIYIKEVDGEVFFAHNFSHNRALPDYEHVSDYSFEDLCVHYGRTLRKLI